MTSFESLLWRILALVLELLIKFHPPRAVRLAGSFGQPRLKPKIQPQPHTMTTTDPITNEQEIDGLCNPVTAGGHPAPIDGPVTWELLDGDATLGTISEDGKTATFRSQDSPAVGTSHFRATADADLGQGTTPISVDYELVVIAPGATAAVGSFGSPRLKT